jgi:hypothetical protein
MENKSPEHAEFSFRLNPAGSELTVYIKCAGIATGTYSIQFGFPGRPDQTREGNIERPEKHQFPADSGLVSIGVRVKSVPFLASDPGSYQVIVEQPGGSRLETPAMPYETQPRITIEEIRE